MLFLRVPIFYPMNKRYFLMLLLLPIGFSVAAQQLSLFTQYRESATIINPAAMESDFLAFGQNLSAGVSYRSQWAGFTGGPQTQTLRLSYVDKGGSGVSLLTGGYLINDVTGPTGFTGLYGRIGGVVSADPEYSGFSVAITGGIVQYRVDADKIRLRDPNDVVGMQSQAQLFPDVGVGLYYYQGLSSRSNDYFYAGFSVPQVIGLNLTFQNEAGEFSTKRVQHFYGMLGIYKFFENESFLEPSMWIKYAPNAPVNADFNLRYQLPTSLWLGAGISTAKNFHLDFGFVLGDNVGFDNIIKLGYGFDYSFSDFGPFAGNTHELNLTFSFDR